MKKTFYIFTFLLLITMAPAIAQKHFYVGVAGLLSTTWVTNQDIYGQAPLDYSFTTGYGGNLSIGYDFSNTIGLKTELGFGTLGQKYTKKINDTSIRRQVKLNYLHVPLLLKVRAGGETAQFYLLIGPEFSFLMSANQTYTKGGVPAPPFYNDEINDTIDVSKSDIKERFASMDIFARLDLGADVYLIKNLFLNIGLTFDYGLMDINGSAWRVKDNDGNYNPSHNVYGGLNLGINYRF